MNQPDVQLTFSEIVQAFCEFGANGKHWTGIDRMAGALGSGHYTTASTEGLLILLQHVQYVLRTTPAEGCHNFTNDSTTSNRSIGCLHSALDSVLFDIRLFATNQFNYLTKLRLTVPSVDGPAGAAPEGQRQLRRALQSPFLTSENRVEIVCVTCTNLRIAVGLRSIEDHIDDAIMQASPKATALAVCQFPITLAFLLSFDPKSLGLISPQAFKKLQLLCQQLEAHNPRDICLGLLETDLPEISSEASWIAPQLVIGVAATKAALAVYEWTMDLGGTHEDTTESLFDLDRLLHSSSLPPDVDAEGMPVRLSHFVVPPTKPSQWPSTIPECEGIVRYLFAEYANSGRLSLAPMSSPIFEFGSNQVVLVAPHKNRPSTADDWNPAARTADWLQHPHNQDPATSYFSEAEELHGALRVFIADEKFRKQFVDWHIDVQQLLIAGAGAIGSSQAGLFLAPDAPQWLMAALGTTLPDFLKLIVHRSQR